MKILKELLIIFCICLLGEGISYLLPITFPSSVISMVILLILLITKVIKVHNIRIIAEFLLGNMAFFFIPAGVSIMENYSALSGNVIKVIIICILTTFITFAATAYTVIAAIRIFKVRSGDND